MAKEEQITKENIRKMVITFYAKVLKDELVGPFFIERLGSNLMEDKWPEHLDLLTNFWASFMTGDNTYRGNPFGPHMTMQGLQRETFARWLELFYESVDSVYEETPVLAFKERASIIAGNFMRNLGLA